MKLTIFLIALAAICLSCEAKVMQRCEIVHALRNQGFPEDKMRDWVCLIEYESHGDTNKVSTVNNNGSRDYGLFQINDRNWCSNSNTPGKECNLTCAEVMGDDITKASNCAKEIYNRHHFNAWYGWRNHCQNADSLPDISSC